MGAEQERRMLGGVDRENVDSFKSLKGFIDNLEPESWQLNAASLFIRRKMYENEITINKFMADKTLDLAQDEETVSLERDHAVVSAQLDGYKSAYGRLIKKRNKDYRKAILKGDYENIEEQMERVFGLYYMEERGTSLRASLDSIGGSTLEGIVATRKISSNASVQLLADLGTLIKSKSPSRSKPSFRKG